MGKIYGRDVKRSWLAWTECAGRSGGAAGLSGVPARGDQDDSSAPIISGGGKVIRKTGAVAVPVVLPYGGVNQRIGGGASGLKN